MATLEELYNHLKTLTSQWFYLKSEITTLLSNKVDKDGDKVLSTNDYTTAEKNKLAGIATGANKITVDTELSSTSTNPLQNKAINTALSNKVDSVSGKGLSSNDYTTAEKTKLEGIAENANNYIHPNYTSKTNGLYKVTVDGSGHISAATSVAKSDITDLGIPAQDTKYTAASATPNADSTNGSVGSSAKYAREDHVHPKSAIYAEAIHSHSAGEVTDSVAHTNIGTAAGATQAAINSAIDTKISSLTNIELIELVSTRPTASASTMNKLYLVPESSAETEDVYEVFVTVKNGSSYSWEKVDTSRIDLSGYVTTSDSRLSDARTPLSHTHGNITSAGAIGSAADKIIVTTTNGVLTTSDMITEMNNVIESLIEYGE